MVIKYWIKAFPREFLSKCLQIWYLLLYSYFLHLINTWNLHVWQLNMLGLIYLKVYRIQIFRRKLEKLPRFTKDFSNRYELKEKRKRIKGSFNNSSSSINLAATENDFGYLKEGVAENACVSIQDLPVVSIYSRRL